MTITTSPNLPRDGGLIPLNKPTGMTSRQVVNRVERLSRPLRAGHTGTLDPLASGVLVVCIGAATRLVEYVQRMRKQYVGVFWLGRQSPTEDIEGDVVELPNAPQPTLEQIEAAAHGFVGRIEQRPPAFSAIKIQGRPAYRLARQGRPVEMKPRPVEIHRIAIRSYQYPELVLEVECGAGTYIRSLGRDLAESLGTAAVMTALQRTAVGRFRVEQSVELDWLTADQWTRYVEPPLRAVESLPQALLTSDEVTRIRNGQTIARHDVDAEEIAALDPAGQLVGILGPAPDDQWRTLRNMPTP
ncbi:MAG: tRNA pseudouridine(55) synthase TruB [Thermoguttaceae bacterium]